MSMKYHVIHNIILTGSCWQRVVGVRGIVFRSSSRALLIEMKMQWVANGVYEGASLNSTVRNAERHGVVGGTWWAAGGKGGRGEGVKVKCPGTSQGRNKRR